MEKMTNTRIFECLNEDATERLASAFANIVKKGDIFALYGTLGAGKSTFSRYFIQSLCGKIDVPSPTFTLIQTYDAPNFEIYHYDMYRLKTPEEAYELGIEESFFNGINLIEWPERICTLLPRDIWKITLSIKENARYFQVEVFSEEKTQRLWDIAYD